MYVNLSNEILRRGVGGGGCGVGAEGGGEGRGWWGWGLARFVPNLGLCLAH